MTDATDLDQLIDQALAYHNAGRLHEAERIYRAVLDADPTHAEAMNFLGVIAMQAGHLRDAEAWCARAIQHGGGAEACNNYGETLRLQQKLDAAAGAYQHAIQLDPHYAEAWSNLGLVQSQAGDLNNAAASLYRAVQLDANLVQAHFNMGVLFRRLGKHEQALDAWRQVLRIDPNHVEALNNVGVLLSSFGRT